MKKLVLTLILNAMILNLSSQNYVYGPDGKRKHFKSEDIDIIFSNPDKPITFPEKIGIEELAPAIISSLPTLVNMGFQLTTSILEKRVKDFSYEYNKSQSYLEAGDKQVPKITFVRNISFNGSDYEKALEIVLVPYEVEKTHGFVYSVDNITLKYSSAKFRKKDSGLDYTIEAKLTLLIDNEKKVIDISPIAISSVKFKENTLNKKEKRSDIIMSQNGALLTEVSLKIVETNPEKVRAEKILSTWNNYKDSTKTIINNFLPKQSQTQGGGNTSTQNKSGNTSTGSGNSK